MRRKPDQLVAAAADSLRTFTHQTRTGQAARRMHDRPEAYRILGSAAEFAYSLPQALTQLVLVKRCAAPSPCSTSTTPTASQPTASPSPHARCPPPPTPSPKPPNTFQTHTFQTHKPPSHTKVSTKTAPATYAARPTLRVAPE
jgi:hypothetical protein